MTAYGSTPGFDQPQEYYTAGASLGKGLEIQLIGDDNGKMGGYNSALKAKRKKDKERRKKYREAQKLNQGFLKSLI